MTRKCIILGLLIAIMVTGFAFGQVRNLDSGVYKCDSTDVVIRVISITYDMDFVSNGNVVGSFKYQIYGNILLIAGKDGSQYQWEIVASDTFKDADGDYWYRTGPLPRF